MGFNYLFVFPPGYVALCGSKAHYRLGSENVSWCLETSLFLRLPSQDGAPCLHFCHFFCLLYLFYLLLKTMGCFSWCLMSSAGIQKLFCEFYSAFKCYFDEFVGEKVVSPSYFSTILGPPLLELSQIHAHRLGDAIQPSYPLSSSSPPTFNVSQGLFQ